MSDTPTLTEALNHEQWFYAHPDGHMLDLMNPLTRIVVAAARAYEAGQDIWWCEEHGEGFREPIDPRCCSYLFNEEKPVDEAFYPNPECRMVLMRLSPVAET